MSEIFVDSNLFLRFFTTDDDGQHAKAACLFEMAASGDAKLVTGPPVLFEIAWTLRAAYSQTKETTLDVLSRIHAMPGLRLTDSGMVASAIGLARASGTEFADAYIAASAIAEEARCVATFNARHFARLGVGMLEW